MTDRIIVIGGSGFLGSKIIQSLKSAGIEDVTCGDITFNNNIDCNFLEIDILNYNDLVSKLQDYSIVINCVGQVTQPFNLCLKLNSVGSNNLSKALLKNGPRLIHISTVAVYGSEEECNEESPLNPETTYATAKAFAEQILLDNYLKKKITILRLTNLYGRFQAKGIFAYLLKSYNSDYKLRFNNNGYLKRSFMHVDDCSDIITKVVKNNTINGIFNIKGEETYYLKDLVAEFEKHFGIEFEKKYNMKVSPWENIEKLDDSKLKSIIKYKFKWKIFDSFAKELDSQINA